jgi:hypothetical protein
LGERGLKKKKKIFYFFLKKNKKKKKGVLWGRYKKKELSSSFVFNNPNETERCGCGESFKVE